MLEHKRLIALAALAVTIALSLNALALLSVAHKLERMDKAEEWSYAQLAARVGEIQDDVAQMTEDLNDQPEATK